MNLRPKTERSKVFDSLQVIARGPDGTVKDARFLHSFLGLVWQFRPNRLYLRLLSAGDIRPDTLKIPFILGSWSVKNA